MPRTFDAAPSGMSPYEVVVDVFGGIRSVARACDIAPSTVLRWGDRPEGLIEARYIRQLMLVARAQGRALTLEELVFGRPHLTRKVVSFGLDVEPPSPFNQMARALTRAACPA